VNRIDPVESDVQPIEYDMLETVDDTNLDVVDDVAGVDSPYEEYVNEWNKDVPEIGDDAIDQVYDDTGVQYEATWMNPAAEDAFEVKDTKAVEFEAVLDYSGLTTLPPQLKAPRGGAAATAAPAQDGDSRPTRVRKPVSRLVPSCKGKSYVTTMAQIGAQMVGMTMTQSIQSMQEELQLMGIGEGYEAAMGVVLQTCRSSSQSRS
jgi:hypothetical protein